MKKFVLLFFLYIITFTVLASDEAISDQDEIKYKNSLEINPTSEGFYIGYERFIPLGDNSLLIFDIKNTAENGDDFGRTGFTYRYGLNDNNLLTGRIEAAWIDGHKNLSARLAYDNQFFGLTMTKIKSMTDPETIRTTETILSEEDASNDTLTETRGDYDVYNRHTITTTRTRILETRQATPDGYMLDLNFNYFSSFNLSLGASRFESENWEEEGFHTNLSLNLTQTDSIGAHYARIDDNEEGGIYYKKYFNSLSDIFKKGPPLDKGQKQPIIHKLSRIPFSIPPIRLVTESKYIEERTETTISAKDEEVLVYNPKAKAQQAPVINSYTVVNAGGGNAEVQVLNATDEDGTIVSWKIVLRDAFSVLATYSGSWPLSLPYVITPGSAGTFYFDLTVTDNDGLTATRTETAII